VISAPELQADELPAPGAQNGCGLAVPHAAAVAQIVV
jgi:hypothetical protein